MSCCGVCGDSVGPTSQARKEHAAREHKYPDCDTCGRIIRNLRMFEDHARTPHRKTKCLIHTCDELVLVGKELEHATTAHGCPRCWCGETIDSNYSNFLKHLNLHASSGVTKKCLLETCDELVLVGKELEHGRTAHGFPNCSCGKTINSNWVVFSRHFNSHKMDVECPACDDVMPDWMLREHAVTRHGFPTCAVCGKTIGSNFANFATHVNSHSFLKAPKIKRRRRRRPLLQPRKHVQTTTAAASSPTPTAVAAAAAVDPSLLDDAVDAYADIMFYGSLMERDDATTTTIPAATEGDHPRLLDAVYYEDNEDDESTPSIPLPPRQARRLK